MPDIAPRSLVSRRRRIILGVFLLTALSLGGCVVFMICSLFMKPRLERFLYNWKAEYPGVTFSSESFDGEDRRMVFYGGIEIRVSHIADAGVEEMPDDIFVRFPYHESFPQHPNGQVFEVREITEVWLDAYCTTSNSSQERSERDSYYAFPGAGFRFQHGKLISVDCYRGLQATAPAGSPVEPAIGRSAEGPFLSVPISHQDLMTDFGQPSRIIETRSRNRSGRPTGWVHDASYSRIVE